ncbi:hypothetical protein DPMN_167556 [Dreissena polymorpha]|uniref:Uncharacterized protein n=1 Tax=Dreissena polymorpha TaxID=45954 RepID=A0A9D4IYW4_DREPO|nr:hypothetical protein DPMN_167556 [Dreissena polymorpha]
MVRIIAYVVVLVILASQQIKTTEALQYIGNCYETWSRCSTWSNFFTGWLWQNCNDRCKSLNNRNKGGKCVLVKSNCPLSAKAYQCQCFT